MNITNVTPSPGSFANGFGYFCVNCGYFFSTQIMDALGYKGEPSFCPWCGEDILDEGSVIEKKDDLINYCVTNNTDTVNFYSAFPPDEPIPQSRTGATPRQVEQIIGCVISDKERKFPVTIESLAANLGYAKEIVAAVFEELHITETEGAA
jgi:hypothetical protein